MWSVAKNSNSCSWRWLPGRGASCCHCRSPGLSGLRHAPCEQPTVIEASALEQRVAFIFSWCTVLTEGRDGETASLGQSAAETSFADTGGKEVT